MIISTNQTRRKEQKCLCISPESRFLFEILICFVNALDGSCKKINIKRQNPIPLIHPCVFYSTDLHLRIMNFNFALQIKRTRRVSENTAQLLFVSSTIIWCHHIELFCCLVSEKERKKIHFANLYLAYYLVWILYLNYKNNFPSKGTCAHTQIHTDAHSHTHTQWKKNKNEADAIAAFLSKIEKCVHTKRRLSFILTSHDEKPYPSMSLCWENKQTNKPTNSKTEEAAVWKSWNNCWPNSSTFFRGSQG